MEKRKTLRGGGEASFFLYGKKPSFTSDVLTCSDFIQFARPIFPIVDPIYLPQWRAIPPDEEELYIFSLFIPTTFEETRKV